MEKYNGWATHDTWAANLWLGNYSYEIYHAAKAIVRVARHDAPARLQTLIDSIGNPDEIDYNNVDWDEVIEAFEEGEW